MAPVKLSVPSHYANTTFIKSMDDFNHQMTLFGIAPHVKNITSLAFTCVNETSTKCGENAYRVTFGKFSLIYPFLTFLEHCLEQIYFEKSTVNSSSFQDQAASVFDWWIERRFSTRNKLVKDLKVNL